jgi:hypothetical protein
MQLKLSFILRAKEWKWSSSARCEELVTIQSNMLHLIMPFGLLQRVKAATWEDIRKQEIEGGSVETNLECCS